MSLSPEEWAGGDSKNVPPLGLSPFAGFVVLRNPTFEAATPTGVQSQHHTACPPLTLGVESRAGAPPIVPTNCPVHVPAPIPMPARGCIPTSGRRFKTFTSGARSTLVLTVLLAAAAMLAVGRSVPPSPVRSSVFEIVEQGQDAAPQNLQIPHRRLGESAGNLTQSCIQANSQSHQPEISTAASDENVVAADDTAEFDSAGFAADSATLEHSSMPAGTEKEAGQSTLASDDAELGSENSAIDPADSQPEESPMEFLSAIDLPALPLHENDTEEVAIGAIKVEGQQLVIAHLLGGEQIGRGRRLELFENSDGRSAADRWEIALKEMNRDFAIIAILTRHDDKVWFSWTSQAAGRSAAAQLRNCGLRFAVGETVVRIALRCPVKAQPLMVRTTDDFIGRWPLTAAPDSDRLRMECSVTAKDREPDRTVIAVGEDRGWIRLSSPQQPEFGLRVETSLKGVLELKATPHFRIAPESPLQRAVPVRLKELHREWSGLAQAQEYQLGLLPAPQNGRRPQGNAAILRGQVQRQLEQSWQVLQAIEQLSDFASRTDKAWELRVRLLLAVEEMDIVLLDMPAPEGSLEMK